VSEDICIATHLCRVSEDICEASMACVGCQKTYVSQHTCVGCPKTYVRHLWLVRVNINEHKRLLNDALNAAIDPFSAPKIKYQKTHVEYV